MGHRPPQHSPLLEDGISRSGAALAGNHEDESMPGILGAVEKADQSRMGFRLAHAVQVDDGIGGSPAAA
jgi:hypothetical protein